MDLTISKSPESNTHKRRITNENTALNLIFIGGPGSGKGTQAKKLSRQLHIPHIASGDLFRENLKNNTDLGKTARTFIDQGKLVPDEITINMLKERLNDADTYEGFLLDGFPRTPAQSEALTGVLSESNRKLSATIYLRVSDDEIVRRLSGRLICRNCQTPYHTKFNLPAKAGICDNCGGPLYQRDDDKPDVIRIRLKTFHQQTEPIINYYRERSLLVEVDAEGSVQEVNTRLLSTAQNLRDLKR